MTAALKKAALRKPAAPKIKAAAAAPAKPADLAAILQIGERMDAGFQKVLDLLTRPVQDSVASPISIAMPGVQTAAENAAERLEAILNIFSGKNAQTILQDMLDSGRPPTREQLLREADRVIAARN